MPRRLSVGKVRGLQQLSDASGIFAMCALDHRGSMQRMIDPTSANRVTAEVLTTYKRDLTEGLAPAATAVLLDPIYGAAQAVGSGALPGQTGLLVSLEETGYETDAQGRTTALLPGWSVEKVKRMGASGAKVLLYYRPDLPENAARQQEVVRGVAAACVRQDLPFLLEPVTYPVTADDRDPAVFSRRLPDLVTQSAAQLTRLDVDVLKTAFPGDLRFERDDGRLRAACDQLAEASQAPWILLSGGVTFDEFAVQVKIACQAGASGFLGGRAVWSEAMQLADSGERRHWLATVGADRLRRLHDIAGQYGRPWWKVWAGSLEALTEIKQDWFQSY